MGANIISGWKIPGRTLGKVKIGLLCFFVLSIPFCVLGQTVVKGKVLDGNSGAPMAFVGVVLKGSNAGTITDEQGYYELSDKGNTASAIQFTFLGYRTMVRNVVLGTTQTIDVVLTEDAQTLGEVVIRSGKVRYRNKDNPAVELIRQAIAHKKENSMQQYPFASYRTYEKLQLAITNPPGSISKNPLIGKRFKFVTDNVDTTRFEGKTLWPIYLEENVIRHYFKSKPDKKKSVIEAIKKVNYDEQYINIESLKSFLMHLYKDIDIYDNNMLIVTNSFLSPLADLSPTFYKFYIRDTLTVEDDMDIVVLSFEPRNNQDFLFTGKIYITLDGRFAVYKAELELGPSVNLNWVSEFHLSLDYTPGKDKRLYLSKVTNYVHFGVKGGKSGAFAERNVSVSNFDATTPFPDTVFRSVDVTKEEDAQMKTEAYWQHNRTDSLTLVEANSYRNMDSLNKMPAYNRAKFWISTFLAGYSQLGAVEVGPVNTFISFNPVEGLKLRAGGRTTPQFSKRFYAESYLSYGFKDERWKYLLRGTIALNNKSIYTYPQHYIRISAQRETSIPGQETQYVAESNILLSFKRGINDKWLYNDIYKLEYFVEFGNHHALGFRLNNWWQEAASGLTFLGTSALKDTVPVLVSTTIGMDWRWAPFEKFAQRKLYRETIPSKYPIINVGIGFGVKGLMEGQYDFQSYAVSISKRFYLSQLGLAEVTLAGRYINGQVPYPLLDIARANQSYANQLGSYNLMNFLEFVSDHNIRLHIDYHMYGFIFNKVPLLKALKLREVVGLKVLYGGLRPENNPLQQEGALFRFPVNANGERSTFALGETPYMELNLGIENIFNLFRVDFVKRLTYLGHPDISPYGVRAGIAIDF